MNKQWKEDSDRLIKRASELAHEAKEKMDEAVSLMRAAGCITKTAAADSIRVMLKRGLKPSPDALALLAEIESGESSLP